MEYFQVRTYTSADYDALCRLDEPLFEGMGGHVLFRHIEELFPNLFFVAENTQTHEILGYILGGIHFNDPKTGKTDSNRREKRLPENGCRQPACIRAFYRDAKSGSEESSPYRGRYEYRRDIVLS